MTGEELFGRQKELEILDKAWDSETTCKRDLDEAATIAERGKWGITGGMGK